MSHETGSVSRTSRVMIGVVAALAVVTAALVLAGAAQACGLDKGKAAAVPAQPANATAEQAASRSPSPAAAPEGMRAFVAPETGQLRGPTPEEAAALTRFIASALAIPSLAQVGQHANGAVSVELGDEFMNDVVVHRNPDGTLSWACVPHPRSRSVLDAPAPPPAGLEKE